jgi:hypothetical protein
MILKMPFSKNKLVEFSPDKGVIQSLPDGFVGSINGSLQLVGDHCVSMYVENGVLYLQVDDARWVLDKNIRLTYRHDVPAQVTHFSISDDACRADISYPAWWKGLGQNVLAVPELDEDNDYLAYVCSVWRNESLRTSLLKIWRA